MTCVCVPSIVIDGKRVAQLTTKDYLNIRKAVHELIASGDKSFIHAGYVEIRCPEHPRQILVFE